MINRLAATSIDSGRLAKWYEMGEVQACVLSLFTTGAAWIAGEIDYRGFLIVNLPLIGKAVYAIMVKKTYRPTSLS